MTCIKNMSEGASVEGFYLVNKKELRNFKTKEGRYLVLKLMDKTGTIDGRLWEDGDRAYREIKAGHVIRINGLVKSFNNQVQIDIEKIETNTDYDPKDFLVIVEDYKKVKVKFLDELKIIKKECGLLAEYIVDEVFDEEYLQKFCHVPAAVKYHHASVGGLMAHTFKVVETTRQICALYPTVDHRLAIMGALLHDIGKVEEMEAKAVIGRTVKGSLQGHIILGCLLLREKAEKIRSKTSTYTDEIESLLIHIIASHHGKLEFGSPVLPMCMEASIVHHADMLDAEIDKYSDSTEEGVVKFNPLLRREVYNKTQESFLIWDEMPF